jgi:hypothetical protein
LPQFYSRYAKVILVLPHFYVPWTRLFSSIGRLWQLLFRKKHIFWMLFEMSEKVGSVKVSLHYGNNCSKLAHFKERINIVFALKNLA